MRFLRLLPSSPSSTSPSPLASSRLLPFLSPADFSTNAAVTAVVAAVITADDDDEDSATSADWSECMRLDSRVGVKCAQASDSFVSAGCQTCSHPGPLPC